MVVVAQGHHQVEHLAQGRLALHVSPEFIGLIIVFVAAGDGPLGIGPRQQHIGTVGKALPRSQRRGVLELEGGQLRFIDDRLAIAQSKGVAGVAPVLEDLGEPILVQQAKLDVVVRPVLSLASP